MADRTFDISSGINKGTKEAARIFALKRRKIRHARKHFHRCGPNCPHISPAAKRFIGLKIETLRHRGVPETTAVAIAFSEARRKGYHIPSKTEYLRYMQRARVR
jgi:hypothetical protein